MVDAEYEATRAYWEHQAVSCHEDMTESVLSLYADEIASALGLRGGERVLDIGCGDGQLDQVLRRGAAAVDGFDVAQSKVDTARRSAPDAHYWCQSFLDPVARTGYDAAFSFSVMQYCLPRDVDRFLDASLAAVRPGGVVAHVAVLDRGRRRVTLTRGRRGRRLLRAYVAYTVYTLRPRRLLVDDGTRFVDVRGIVRRRRRRGDAIRVVDCPYDRTRTTIVMSRPSELRSA